MKAFVYVLAGIGGGFLAAHLYMRGWRGIREDAFRSIGRSA